MSDQHNANCTGYAGHPDVKTPNLDKLAANSVNFVNGFANNPICSPSRICFHTGQYMRTHRMYGNYHNWYMKSNPDTLGSLFRRYGYQTALIGKSHMIPLWDREGFEHIRYTDLCDAERNDPCSCHYFDYLCQHGLADGYEEGTEKPGQDMLDGRKPSQLPYEHTIEAFTGREAVKFLNERDTDRPFLMHLSFQRPHSPISPAKEFFDMYDPDSLTLPESYGEFQETRLAGKPAHLRNALGEGRPYPLSCDDEKRMRRCLASYYGLISAIDMEIGRVLDLLEQTGELENTIVIYTADHGDFAGEHGLFHKNFGLYESIQQIPYLVSWPGAPAGMQSTTLVESIDVYPTLCELCNVPQPDGRDGTSLVKMLNGEGCKDAVFCEWITDRRLSSVRTERYRLVYYSGYDDGELYDHETDPQELINLWDRPEHSAVQQKLLRRLLDFSMQYARETDSSSDRALLERDRFSPAKMVHLGRIYWSDLEQVYTTVRPWKTEG
jgi:choline-sulfatase/uncharacterized sulfatase